jgi:hypothetical protein
VLIAARPTRREVASRLSGPGARVSFSHAPHLPHGACSARGRRARRAGSPPSNRTVGARAGISDQGQTSKLLARLCRIGLIANSGLAPGQGAPNAWTLTDRIRASTEGLQ